MFDIILPAYKNLSNVKECLHGFEKQTFWDSSNQLFLCINGDPEPFLIYLEDRKKKDADFENSGLETGNKLNIIPLFFTDRKNHGRAANRNQALPHLKSRYVLYQDSDLIPDEGLLQTHFDLLEKQDCISVGMVDYTNRSENEWANYQYFTGRAKFKDTEVIPSHYLNTQNVALKTTYLQKLEGQMESLVHYGGDDTELGYRMSKVLPEIPTLFNASAISRAEMDKTLSKALSDVYEFGQYNLPKIVEKHPDFDAIYRIGDYRKSWMLRTFIHFPLLRQFIYLFRFVAPVKAIHYLTINAVYRGYNMRLK